MSKEVNILDIKSVAIKAAIATVEELYGVEFKDIVNMSPKATHKQLIAKSMYMHLLVDSGIFKMREISHSLDKATANINRWYEKIEDWLTITDKNRAKRLFSVKFIKMVNNLKD